MTNTVLTVVIDDAREEQSARALFDAAFQHVAAEATGHKAGTQVIKSGPFTSYEIVVVGPSHALRPLFERDPAVAFYRGRKCDS